MNSITPALVNGKQNDRKSSASASEISDLIDLRAIFAALLRHKFVALSIVALSLFLGVASILLSSKIFEATATVQIEQQTTKVLGTEQVDPVAAGSDANRFIQTQVDILRSRSLAARVSQDLALETVDDFFIKMGSKEPEDVSPRERANAIIDTLLDNMRASPPLESRVVGISVRSIDPVLSARLANSFANNFILNNIERRYSSSDYSRQFLRSELSKAQAKLEESERNLIGYARNAGLIDLSSNSDDNVSSNSTNNSLVTSNLVQLNKDYASALAKKLEAQGRWESASGVSLMSIPQVLSDNTIQQLSQQKAKLTGELAELRQRIKPDHPSYIQKSAQISEIEAQLNHQAQNIRSSIKNDYLTATGVETELANQIARFKANALNERDRGVRYNILKREVDTNRQLYDSLLQRYKEISAEAGITANNVSIVDEAEIPSVPVLPRPAINMALSILLGLGLAGGYIFVREHFDDAIRNPTDLDDKLGIRLLGVVPKITDCNPVTALRDKRDAMSEAYATIRSSIDLLTTHGAPSSILITSSRMSEGKSTTSYALATKFAESNRKTLLIDADMRRPSLHRLFDLKRQEKGFSTILANQTEFAECMLATTNANLDYLPAGAIPPDPTLLLTGEKVRHLLTTLQQIYSVIIVDGPPVLALADATLLAANIESTIFVTETGGSHFGQIKHAVHRLTESRANIIGGIITKFDRKSARYGSEMEYYYNYSYHDVTSDERN